MKPHPENLETMLRSAPVPTPPADLKAKLLRAARAGVAASPSAERSGHLERTVNRGGGGWPRWLLLLLPTGMVAALATVALVQQDQVRGARAELEQLVATQRASALSAAADTVASDRSAPELPDKLSEIARLRDVLARLEIEAAAVARLEAENAALKQAIVAARASLPPELKELEQAKDRAASIQCVNNLKQMGLAVRIYATDNGDEFPPDILAMKNELATPKILVCPSDPGRTAADNWETYSAAHLSYEFLSPGPGKLEFEPTRVLFRCPFHGNIGLCDGSVQMRVAKDHPEWLVPRNGALYMDTFRPEPASQGSAGPGGPPSAGTATPGMPESLARRYGLIPANPAGSRLITETVQGAPGGGETRTFTWGLETDGEGGPTTLQVETVGFGPDGEVLTVEDSGAFQIHHDSEAGDETGGEEPTP